MFTALSPTQQSPFYSLYGGSYQDCPLSWGSLLKGTAYSTLWLWGPIQQHRVCNYRHWFALVLYCRSLLPYPYGSLEVQLSVLHTNYECPSLSPQGCDVDLSLPFNKNRGPIRWPPLLLLGCVTWVMFLIITHFRFFNPSAILFLFMHYNAHLIIFAHNLAINIWRSAGVLTVIIMPSCWDPSTTI